MCTHIVLLSQNKFFGGHGANFFQWFMQQMHGS